MTVRIMTLVSILVGMTVSALTDNMAYVIGLSALAICAWLDIGGGE